MDTFNTKAGTVLPLMNIKGKDYLQVAHRVQWFREEHPNWAIETEVRPSGNSCISKATIKNESGCIIATSHKYEDAQGFGDFIEKSETGAIGRALALCGYGTQFATDLDEGERLADSPVEPKKGPLAAIKPPVSNHHEQQPLIATRHDEYVLKTGNSKGLRLVNCIEEDLLSYITWIQKRKGQGGKLSDAVEEDLIKMGQHIEYLRTEHSKESFTDGPPPLTDDDIPF